MSVGVGDLSLTPAEPNTATWVCVTGNPDLSKDGRSTAFALIPPSTTNVAPIIEKNLLTHTSVQNCEQLSSKAREQFGYAAPLTS
ncbi:hypothetical protein QA641_15850 [Bradyrhizobium sp. CB1650]|uniref:hypothetical protein n=1 Tax=Bradyrhizobium sp. CB1650 TaxID=3039153 RepID=UPI0024348A45|nr:hypothetical protein [Bradyrhizobium sp. CB1650]WGD55217.1 hypothetical protein QA641_15850 [Bradyrhizobium sp. CB1650]